MTFALLTTLLFSLSVIFATRSARVLGPQTANLVRLLLATALLAGWAWSFGKGVQGPGLWWLVLSGVIGFGLGDMALFAALSRIGPRLTILLTQCLTSPIGSAVEYVWLGTALRPAELVCGGVILAGVAVALAPDHGWVGSRRTFWVGALFGLGSAAGQALGAVISRKAYAVNAGAGLELDGGTAAFQRILGGIVLTVLCYALFTGARRGQTLEGTPGQRWRKGTPLVVANALAGPTLGVACYQWALHTTPSGVVLPIVALSPLVTMVLVAMLDGTRPTRRAVIGGVLAVAGAVALARTR